jgi:hypothetical protein
MATPSPGLMGLPQTAHISGLSVLRSINALGLYQGTARRPRAGRVGRLLAASVPVTDVNRSEEFAAWTASDIARIHESIEVYACQ